MPQCCLPRPKQQTTESGFLLVGLTVVLLVIIAMVSSFSFVVTRENRFQGNYAAGQRLAWLANAAHIYAQQTVYRTGTGSVENLNLYVSGMNIPDNQAFAPIKNTDFSIEIIGKDQSPVAGATTFKAASAYLHLRVRPRGGQVRLPNDTLALQAGAASANLSRMGFYKTNIDPSDECNAEPAANIAVRWGPEDSSCLTDDQAVMFTDLRPGDIIVPAWETALAKVDRNALLRYPQPERPSYNAMADNLNMNGHDIREIQDTNIDELNPTTGTAGALNVAGNLATQSATSAPMTFTFKDVVANQKLTIAGNNPAGKGMTVDGQIIFASNVSVADTISRKGTLGLRAEVQNNPPVPTDGSERLPSFFVQALGKDEQNIVLTPIPTNPAPPPGDTTIALATRFLSGNISNLTLSRPGVEDMRLAVSGTINSPNARIRANGSDMNIYAAILTTKGTNTITLPTTGTWKIGAINQKDAANPLTIERVTANKCNGPGCPTAVIDLPEVE